MVPPEPPIALPVEEVATPGTDTIASLAALMDVATSRTAKAAFFVTGDGRRSLRELILAGERTRLIAAILLIFGWGPIPALGIAGGAIALLLSVAGIYALVSFTLDCAHPHDVAEIVARREMLAAAAQQDRPHLCVCAERAERLADRGEEIMVHCVELAFAGKLDMGDAAIVADCDPVASHPGLSTTNEVS